MKHTRMKLKTAVKNLHEGWKFRQARLTNDHGQQEQAEAAGHGPELKLGGGGQVQTQEVKINDLSLHQGINLITVTRGAEDTGAFNY